MPGFVTRRSRSALGPHRVDLLTAPNDINFVRDYYFNLGFAMGSGMAQTCARAFATVASDGTLESAGETWDPDGESEPVVTHPGTGHYVLTYASTYEDGEGDWAESVATGLVGAHITLAGDGTVGMSAQYEITDGCVVDVWIRNHANTLADAGFTIDLK